jgi:hypothetical protein
VSYDEARQRWPASITTGRQMPNFGNIVGADSPNTLKFERTTSEGTLVLRDPHVPVWFTAGFWRESEVGWRPHFYYGSKITRQEIDRYTRDITGAVEATLGNGYLGYELLTRKFSEAAPTAQDATHAGTAGGIPNRFLNIFSEQAVLKNKLTGTYRLSDSLRFAAGAASLHRKHYLTQYTYSAYSGHAGVAYSPSKDLAFNGRFYTRINQVSENNQSLQYTVNAANSATNRGKDMIDAYIYRADLKARYTGIKNTALRFGYKPQYTYRRGEASETSTFDNTVMYQDGESHGAWDVSNRTEAKELRHTFLADAEFELPMESEFGLALKEVTADRGAWQYMPTRESDQVLSLQVPLSHEVHFSANGGLQYAANNKASFAKFRRRGNYVLLGLNWNESENRGSLGVNYGVEQGRELFDVFMGDVNSATVYPIHMRMPYEYKNQTVGANGSVKLPREWTATGNAAYTLIQGDYLTGGAMNSKFETGTMDFSNYYPTKVASTRWGVGLEYGLAENMTARAAFDQIMYLDRYDGEQNGRAELVTLSASAKF